MEKRKGQSKTMSFVESITNVAVGLVIALISQFAIFGALDIKVSLHQNLLICAFMTIVSIVRSYTLRRVFERIHAWQDR